MPQKITDNKDFSEDGYISERRVYQPTSDVNPDNPPGNIDVPKTKDLAK